MDKSTAGGCRAANLQRGATLARGRPGVAATHRIIAVLFVFLGVFLLCFGVGNNNVVIAVVGVLAAAFAAATRLGASLRPRQRQWVLGTGRVVLVSDDPPATGEYGRCELQLTVTAPGLPTETVVVRASRVPVDQWPYPGQELPIKVAADNVRNVRVQWSMATAGSWPEEDDALLDDQPDPVPRQPPGSHLDPPPTAHLDRVETELIDFDIDEPLPPSPDIPTPPTTDEPLAAPADPRPTPRPSPRPTPRPREAAEPAAEALPAAATAVAEAPVTDLITTYPSAHPSPTTAIHGVGVTLLVAELTRSVEFYRDLLGFYEVDGGEGNVVLASGGTRMVLRATSDLGRINRRLVHLNLEVGDIDAVYAELKANGVRFTYAPRVVNQSARLELWGAAFRDPDGHGVAIAQWRTPS